MSSPASTSGGRRAGAGPAVLAVVMLVGLTVAGRPTAAQTTTTTSTTIAPTTTTTTLLPRHVCVSVFRYGNSGWTGAAINADIFLANAVWAQAGINWVWSNGAIEDIPDLVGVGDGDIEGAAINPGVDSNHPGFPSQSKRKVGDDFDGDGNSRDVAAILAATADAECYPVVYVGTDAPWAGATRRGDPVIVPALALAAAGASTVGRMVMISRRAFPRADIPPGVGGTWRRENLISTLAHELGHSLCLDLPSWHTGVDDGNAAVDPNWSPPGDRHPPFRVTPAMAGGPYDPYSPAAGIDSLGGFPLTNSVPMLLGAAPPPPPPLDGLPVAVPVGHADSQAVNAAGGPLPLVNNVRRNVMWYTGEQQGPDPLTALPGNLSAQQIAVARFCVDHLRARYSPSFSTVPGGLVVHNRILWAPALPGSAVPPPVALGLGAGDGLDALSNGKDFQPGRYLYKFAVDHDSNGAAGTAVRTEASMPAREAQGDEFAGPAPPNGNVQILDEGQFGLPVAGSEAIDALVQDSPAEPGAALDANLDGVLDAGARVYFSVAPGVTGMHPADIFVATGAAPNPPAIEKYADAATGLGLDKDGTPPDDDVDALCVQEVGGDPKKFEPGMGDYLVFSVTRSSPTANITSADVLGPGPGVVTTAAALGLVGTGNADELSALKCYVPVVPTTTTTTTTTTLPDFSISSDECKCQVATAKAQGKFFAAKQKCITRCRQGVRKGTNPPSDCDPPYAGATDTCVSAAEQKAIDGEVKKCVRDCPECYASGSCPADAAARTAAVEADVDGIAPLAYCDDSGSPDGETVDEQKCQDATLKALAKLAAKRGTCYAKCRRAECGGKIPPGSCVPPATDPKTQECLAKEEGKCTATIAKRCTADKPECYGATPDVSFCGLATGVVDGDHPATYCASPGGAFLD